MRLGRELATEVAWHQSKFCVFARVKMANCSSDEDEGLMDEVEVVEAGDDDDLEWEDVETENDADDEEEYSTSPVSLECSDALVTFKHHSEALICCDFQSDCNYALTGGQDDCAYLWNIDTGDVVFKCYGHNDTVANVSFSNDGKLFATADMNGVLKVWDCKKLKKIWQTETSSEIIWIKWHPSSHVIIAGTVTGDVWLWSCPTDNCKIFPSHGVQTDCGVILPDGLRAFVGYTDGSTKTLDLKKGTTIHHFKGGNSHNSLVTVVDCFHDNVLTASASQDCTVKILNTQSHKVLATLDCTLQDDADEEKSVEGLAFHPSEAILVTGNLKGFLQVWDVSKYTQLIVCDNEAGIIKLLWHPGTPFVYTGAVDGVVRRWDTRNGEAKGSWVGHTRQLFDIAINKTGSRLLSAAEDRTSCIFNTEL